MFKESDLIKISKETSRKIKKAIKSTNSEVIQPVGLYMNRGPRLSRRKAIAAIFGATFGTIAVDRGIEAGIIPDPFKNVKFPDNPFTPQKKEDTPVVDISKPSVQTSLDRPKYIPKITELIDRFPSHDAFDVSETNEIAREIGIEHTGKRFEVNNKSLNTLESLRKAEALLPVYPEAVYQYKDIIYKASKRYKIPPNIIALIITNRSLGYKDSIQGGENVGLGQLSKDVLMKYTGTLDFLTMQNPEVNIDVLTQHFKAIFERTDEYIDSNPNIFASAQRGLDSEGKINYKYIKSLIAYSEGFDSNNKSFENLSSEARWSYENYIRFFQDADIAQRLLNKGFDKSKVIQKMQSAEVAARVFAFHNFRRKLMKGRSFIYDTAKYGNDILSYETVEEGLNAIKERLINPATAADSIYRRAAMNIAGLEGMLNEIVKDYKSYFGKEQELIKTPPALAVLNQYQYLNGIDGSTKINGEENHLYYLSPVNQFYRNAGSIDITPPEDLALYPNNAILFNQLDPKWRDSTDKLWLDGRSSCGPTAFAMALNRFGIKIDKNGNILNPSTISKTIQKFNLRTGDGSTLVRDRKSPYDGVSWLKEQGLELIILSEGIPEQGEKPVSFQELKNYIDGGFLIMASGFASYVNGDHIFLITEVDPERKTFIVADPWGAVIRERSLDDYRGDFYYSYALRRKS